VRDSATRRNDLQVFRAAYRCPDHWRRDDSIQLDNVAEKIQEGAGLDDGECIGRLLEKADANR
jgi:hypothetical protein